MSRNRLLDALTVAVAMAANASLAVAMQRERRLLRSGSRPINAPTIVTDWDSYGEAGQIVRDDTAAVTIVEFADFECPFCRRFHATLDSVRQIDGARIRLVYRHFPLRGHRFAISAVRASECAGDQGKFAAMHDALYIFADSVGLVPWSWFAEKVDIADAATFARCVRDGRPLLSLARDTADGRRLRVTGTPTLLVGPLRVNGAPSRDSLLAYIARARELALKW